MQKPKGQPKTIALCTTMSKHHRLTKGRTALERKRERLSIATCFSYGSNNSLTGSSSDIVGC